MIEKRNDCVGCETCQNCGNDKDYYVHVCDSCGCEAEEVLYLYNGKEYCPECLIEHFIADGIIQCELCHEEVETEEE